MEGQIPNYQYLLRLASYNFSNQIQKKQLPQLCMCFIQITYEPCTDMVVSIDSQGRLLDLNPIPPFNSCVILEAYFPYLQNGGINSYFTGLLIRSK